MVKRAEYGDISLLEIEDLKKIPVVEREKYYGEMVERLIRARYNLSAELAILRQKDEKPEEFAEYFVYAEQCKLCVKAFIKEE